MMEMMALKMPRLDGWNSWNGDGWMDGWMMDGWMDGWVEAWVEGWMNHGVDLILGLQSTTVLTMVEAWVALFGRIHGMELVFVWKRVSSSTIRPSSCSQKDSRRDFRYFTASSGTQKRH